VLTREELDDPAHPEHARLRDWYRTLIAVRRTVPDLGSGDLTATDLVWGGASERDPDDVPWDGWLVLHRGAARVVVNLSGEEVTVPVETDGPLDVVAAWDAASVEPTPGGALVVTPPRSVVVLA
jgi:maltooligosyltrehalose trehalohydrolase